MNNQNRNIRLEKLLEREKELNCLYSVENLLMDDNRKLGYVLQNLVKEIPSGWQYPDICECCIILEDKNYETENFKGAKHKLTANIIVGDHVAGYVEVGYLNRVGHLKEAIFLSEEQKLLNTIAVNIGKSIFRRQLKSTLEYINSRGNNDQSYEDDLIFNPASDEHWKWRFEMVGRIAEHLDMERFGIKGLYLIGSTKNANAGPCSDIDLLVHSCGDLDRDKQLKIWLEGWGYCLSEMNFHKTGCQSKDSLIDLHIITDEDIRKKDSYARLIGAISDGARPIKFTDQH